MSARTAIASSASTSPLGRARNVVPASVRPGSSTGSRRERGGTRRTLVDGIAPGCVLAEIALARGRCRGIALALTLLSVAALLLPMFAPRTIVQVRAGVRFGPVSAAPFVGFAIVSAGAIGYLSRLARSVSLSESKVVAGA